MTRASKSTFLAVGALGLAGLVGGAQASEVLYDEIPGGTVTIVASRPQQPPRHDHAFE